MIVIDGFVEEGVSTGVGVGIKIDVEADGFADVFAVFVSALDAACEAVLADCVGKRFTVQPVTNKEATTRKRTNITVIGLNRIHLYKW